MLIWQRIRSATVTVVISRGAASDAGAITPSIAQRAMGRPVLATLLLALFVAGSAAALFAKGGYVELRDLRQRRDAANRQLDRQLADVHQLHKEVDRLKGDSVARERLAREELGYARKGEMVFLLAEPRKKKPPTAP